MGTFESIDGTNATFRGRKNATQKIPTPRERISFRDLARLAYPKKPIAALVERTGKDESTVKRWMSRRSRAPDRAVYIVLGEIFQRLE